MRIRCRREDLMAHAYGFLDPAESAVVESHVLTCEACREELCELRGESMLVAFELSLDTGVSTTVEEPRPKLQSRPRAVRPLLAATGLAAALLLCLFALSRVLVQDPPTTPVVELPEDPRVAPAEGRGGETPPPAPSRIVFVEKDPDPALLARIRDLEQRLRELEAGETAGNRFAALTPEQAVEAHDWGGLAEILARLAPETRIGRLTDDPETLASYLESLRQLEELVAVAEVPSTISGLARDPRTGPKLFAAVLAQSWPDAPAIDLARAEDEARVAITRYRQETDAAVTDAERDEAEEHLSRTLADTVEGFEEQHGTPVEDVVTEPPENAGDLPPEKPEVSPRDAADEPDKETGKIDPALSPTTTRVLSTASYRVR